MVLGINFPKFRRLLAQRKSETLYECKEIKMVKSEDAQDQCPAANLLKQLTGKWKPQIFSIASVEPVRFNTLLRRLEGSNKQAVATALKEMEEQDLIEKTVIKLKPLHIEYTLSERGKALIPIFRQLEHLS